MRWARSLVIPFVAAGLAATAAPAPAGAGLLPPITLPPIISGLLAPLTATTTVSVGGGDLGPVNGDLVGFNWRAGGQVVAPLGPRLVRIWSVDFSRITPAPGVFDWSGPDAEVATIRAMGAIPLIVLVDRPPYADVPGSPGYEDAVRAAVQRYGVDLVDTAAGQTPAWFESGNEPEFPPTSHGQFLTDLPLDAAAQARAVRAVEAATGVTQRWGGPGSLMPDPVAVELLAAGAALGGRAPDYLSWHAYTNQPLLGPDGVEGTDALSVLGQALLGGTNPVATPLVIGLGAEVMRLTAALHTAPDGDHPEIVLTEWHLSSGGMDRRHDTHVGAAHTLAGLVELQTHGVDAAAFFAAADRHCPQPPGPDPRCGDHGVATADGQTKPTYWAFDWWRRLASGNARALPVAGSSPLTGLWAFASRSDDGTVRILLSSFSALLPADRTVKLAGVTHRPGATIRRIADAGGAAPAAQPLPANLTVSLPADTAALIEIPPAP